MAKDRNDGKNSTQEPETENSSLTSTGNSTRRSGGILRTVTNRLRIAAHLSRARRSEQLTEPTIGLVIDDHELYVRPETKIKKSNSTVNKTTTTTMTTNNKPQTPSTPHPISTDRQISRVSYSEKIFSNRYILSHGKIHFWKNYAYGEGHPYIKVTHDVHIEDIAYIMHRHWRMESPRIVALIISNVAPLDDWSNSRQITAFKKGLMKVSLKSYLKNFLNSKIKTTFALNNRPQTRQICGFSRTVLI
jgi:hypothetical protein